MNRNEASTAPERPETEFSAARKYPLSFSIFALARSHRGLAAQLLREANLYPGQEIMLMQLWAQDCQPQSSLCRVMRLDHSTVAKSVRRLVDAGLVTCGQSEDDRRVTLVSLTPAGRDLEARVDEAWKRLESVTAQGLTEEEFATMLALSRKIAAKLDSSADPSGDC